MLDADADMVFDTLVQSAELLAEAAGHLGSIAYVTAGHLKAANAEALLEAAESSGFPVKQHKHPYFNGREFEIITRYVVAFGGIELQWGTSSVMTAADLAEAGK